MIMLWKFDVIWNVNKTNMNCFLTPMNFSWKSVFGSGHTLMMQKSQMAARVESVVAFLFFFKLQSFLFTIDSSI